MSTQNNPQSDPRRTAFNNTATALAELVRSVVVDAPRAETLREVGDAASVTHEPWSESTGRSATGSTSGGARNRGEGSPPREIARLSAAVAELQVAVARIEASLAASPTRARKPGRRAKG